MRYGLVHLVWACMCVWAASPAWIMASGRPPIQGGYTTLLPFAIVAIAFAQWSLGGSLFPPTIRWTPWLLLFLIYCIVQGGLGVMMWSLGAVALVGAGHVVGTVVCFYGSWKKPVV